MSPEAADLAVPGNVVVSGPSVWYPASTGVIKRFDLQGTFFDAGTDVTGVATGTIYGLSLYGSRIAGGGGGGVNRLFVKSTDNTGAVTGYNMGSHVSGVAVGAGQNLFAVTQSASSGTLRKFDSSGDNVLASAVAPSGFAFPFAGSSTPGATTPVLGNGGFVYATANNGGVLAAGQQTLDVRWVKALPTQIGGQVVASPTLDCNRTAANTNTGIYYFATTTGWVVAYITDSPGLDTTAIWPKYQHDARNTGNTGVSLACP